MAKLTGVVGELRCMYCSARCRFLIEGEMAADFPDRASAEAAGWRHVRKLGEHPDPQITADTAALSVCPEHRAELVRRAS